MAKEYLYEDVDEQAYSSSGITDKITFMLIGGGIGAALALLLAPKSGRELRGDIADVTRKGYDKTRETAQQLKENSGTYYNQLKGQANDLYSRATEARRTGNADKALYTSREASEGFKSDIDKQLNVITESNS